MPALGYLQGSETEIAWVGSALGHTAGGHQYLELPAMPENGTLGDINVYLRFADAFDQNIVVFIADPAGNILWQSGQLSAGADPGLVTADASGASLALSSGVKYVIGVACESVSTGARVISKAGGNWWLEGGAWPNVNDPLAFGDPSNYTSDYTLLGHINYTPSSIPTISNVDGDNAVNQYQLCNINVSNFTETITSVTINAVAVESIPDNDPTDDVIQVRMPGSLATGSYDVVVSGATETDTISGVSYTQTHPVQLPTGTVDSNSILYGQTYDQDGSVYMDNAAAPYEITGEGGSAVGGGETMSFTGGYTDWSDAPLANDVDDYLAAPAEFTGWMRSDHTRIYKDGTTASWGVEYQVTDGSPSVFASYRATKMPTRMPTKLPTRNKL